MCLYSSVAPGYASWPKKKFNNIKKAPFYKVKRALINTLLALQ